MAAPESIIDAMPLVRHALPIRFANYVYLVMAIIVSLWLTVLSTPLKRVLAVAAFVTLLPNPALLFHQSRYDTPEFFAHKLYRNYLHAGDNVLIIPYATNGPSMAWQAESEMYFRMPGGYLGQTPAEFRRWPIVNTLLTALPVARPKEQLAAFLAANQVDAIVVAQTKPEQVNIAPATDGIQPVKVGGVEFYGIVHDSGAVPPMALDALQRVAAEAWFAQLLCAADRFLASGHKVAELNPANLHQAGLLPDSKWGRKLDLVIAATPHGVFNGLWIGPDPDGSIAVGMFASRAAASALIASHRSTPSRVLYPYPERYTDQLPSSDEVHFLLIRLRRATVANACLARTE
jgi:hypothetical protein